MTAEVETREHELKCWPEFFEEVASGRKTFEIRENDRQFKVGDVLRLCEYRPAFNTYTGKQVLKRVTYLTEFQQRENVVVMGLEDLDAPALTQQRHALQAENARLAAELDRAVEARMVLGNDLQAKQFAAEAQRDALLAALRELEKVTRFRTKYHIEIPADEWQEMMEQAEAAIARADASRPEEKGT